MKVYPVEFLERCLKLQYSCSRNSLKAKCARHRGESVVLFKNEHAAQARARWHVRNRHAGLGRRAKNISFS